MCASKDGSPTTCRSISTAASGGPAGSTRPASAMPAMTTALLRVDDLDPAAKLCERFAHQAWPRVLNALARRVNPMMPIVPAAHYRGHYLVLDQAENAPGR